MVITATEATVADVLIEGERIIGVVATGSELSGTFAAGAGLVIDATGRYVLPGGVDAHTHFQSDGQAVPVLDTFETGTRAAALGGTTTIIDFAQASPGQRMTQGWERYRAMADGQCAIDYGLHLNCFEVDEHSPAEMDRLVGEGVTSFKMFMAYPDRLYSTDAQILRMMQQAAGNGSLIMMHAENGIAMDLLRDQAVARGDTGPIWHARTRPPLLEAEAVHRACVLAQVAGSPLYIVHLSSAEALGEIVTARDRGWNVFAETCPQYLFLDQSLLLGDGDAAGRDTSGDFAGARYVCSPPLRPKEHQAELWRGLRTGDLSVVATDHCPFCWSQRELGRTDFRAIPNGLPGVRHRVELLYQGAVAEGRLSLSRWVDLCATTPAKMFGLHPRKGTIAPGSDADVVVFDPHAPATITAASHDMNVDYSVYEGFELTGTVRHVLLRGRQIVRDGSYVGQRHDGVYLPRAIPSLLR
ncbi:MAG: dihydropyrimidinase [Acidimicrobiales bacterium]